VEDIKDRNKITFRRVYSKNCSKRATLQTVRVGGAVFIKEAQDICFSHTQPLAVKYPNLFQNYFRFVMKM